MQVGVGRRNKFCENIISDRLHRKGSTIVTINASLRTGINICQPTRIINTGRCYLISSDTNSFAHRKWDCKYHIVFAPKNERQVIYGKIQENIGIILRLLCERKGVEIIEAEACKD
ncbi:transposase, partial [Staphylococcus aureus]|uniref:transposase n=1 Tax=Staphylococcus aureus TaxID=1280 RepID=UPI0021CB7B6C